MRVKGSPQSGSLRGHGLQRRADPSGLVGPLALNDLPGVVADSNSKLDIYV